jgi:hypothetical protein
MCNLDRKQKSVYLFSKNVKYFLLSKWIIFGDSINLLNHVFIDHYQVRQKKLTTFFWDHFSAALKVEAKLIELDFWVLQAKLEREQVLISIIANCTSESVNRQIKCCHFNDKNLELIWIKKISMRQQNT